MKKTIKYRINPTQEQENCLNKLGFYATKLYNTDNYIRRKAWDETGKIPHWMGQKKVLRTNHWFKLLPSQTAQRVIKNLQENYQSWFQLRKTDPDANPPMFRNKNKLSVLTFYQQFKIKDNTVSFSMSRQFAKETEIKKLCFEFKNWKQEKGIAKMCNIIKEKNKWMIHIVYEIEELSLNKHKNVMAVDLGIINLMATADTNGNKSVFKGGQVLAVQHYFNKEIAKVQSKSMKQQKKEKTKAIIKMHTKKFRQINQIIHTATKTLVDNAVKNKIGTIVVGDIKNIRKNKNWSKKSSQKLHSWSFGKLTSQIQYKAKEFGIRVIKISERDTSKTCSNCGVIKKSNRKHRGLYKCSCGSKINADINGALNILKKYLRETNNNLLVSKSIGSVVEPLIWKCKNVVPT